MGKNGTNDASDAAKPEISDLPDEEVVKLSLKDPSLFALFVDKYEEAFMRAAFSFTRRREEAVETERNRTRTARLFALAYLETRRRDAWPAEGEELCAEGES